MLDPQIEEPTEERVGLFLCPLCEHPTFFLLTNGDIECAKCGHRTDSEGKPLPSRAVH